MRFVEFDAVRALMEGKRVVIVGSGPSVLRNKNGVIDSHDVVVRVNNYKLKSSGTGRRTDVHYSFYGRSIRKSASELRRDGVKLCLCKCPDGMPLTSEWHIRNGKINGIDFRYIYRMRKVFWFCDTYVPDTASFLKKFFMLESHVPTTGFSAILDVLDCKPKSIYLTGFDFFTSAIHNVNKPWIRNNPLDPIGHVPEAELAWLANNVDRHPIIVDNALAALLGKSTARAA